MSSSLRGAPFGNTGHDVGSHPFTCSLSFPLRAEYIVLFDHVGIYLVVSSCRLVYSVLYGGKVSVVLACCQRQPSSSPLKSKNT